VFCGGFAQPPTAAVKENSVLPSAATKRASGAPAHFILELFIVFFIFTLVLV
jgi:hypothetical protein